MIGVATADLKNQFDKYSDINSLCVGGPLNYLYNSSDKRTYHNFKLKTGDIVSVRRSAHEIQWVRGE